MEGEEGDQSTYPFSSLIGLVRTKRFCFLYKKEIPEEQKSDFVFQNID